MHYEIYFLQHVYTLIGVKLDSVTWDEDHILISNFDHRLFKLNRKTYWHLAAGVYCPPLNDPWDNRELFSRVLPTMKSRSQYKLTAYFLRSL